jgi:putative nucleotidyltransferase with HDIG domain
MARKFRLSSIFSQTLDRVVFTAYLLGAVVPLVALAVVVERFVMPTISDRNATLGLIGALVSIAVLSLASFLTLRRTTRRSLDQMDGDNRRLVGLLEASRGLAGVEHASDAGAAAANAALAITGAEATYVFLRTAPGAPPTRLAEAGSATEKLGQKLAAPLLELTKLVMSDSRPAARGPDDGWLMLAAPVPGEGAPVGALLSVANGGGHSNEARELDALSTLAGLASVALHNADLRDAQRNFFTHVTDLLVSAVDSQLGYHEGHGMRVAQYANRIGRKLGLADHRLQRLHFAALLHDIGMLKLDREQQHSAGSAVKHTLLGARMLARIRLWEEVAPIVQHHHEWWDGSGYPEGSSGPSIPLESRIISVCDALDTMTSDKSYKTAIPFEAAVREIESGTGTQFDPDVVTAFRALVTDGVIEPETPEPS